MKSNPIIFLFFVLFLVFSTARAQFTHEFTQTARNTHYGNAQGVAVGSDGTVFLANEVGGLRAYSYDGSSFTNTAHINDGGKARSVAVGPDGTVFLANGEDGLRAYSYDGSSFTNTAHINDGGNAFDVAVGSDGTVFLANDYDGLRAYSYDGSPFTNTAYINDGGNALDVTVGSDDTVFLANKGEGLIAYSYAPVTGIEDNSVPVPAKYSLRQNYPNPFNPTTTIEFALAKPGWVTLKIYNILGEEVAELVSENLSAGSYKYNWDALGLASGVYLYRIETDNFVHTRKMLLIR